MHVYPTAQRRVFVLPIDQAGRPFEANVEQREGATAVVLRGELDVAAREAAATALAEAIAGGSGFVLVDLRGLAFMDLTGLHCLYDAKLQADAAGTPIVILDGSGPPHRLLALSGIDEVFEMMNDPAQAESALATTGSSPHS